MDDLLPSWFSHMGADRQLVAQSQFSSTWSSMWPGLLHTLGSKIERSIKKIGTKAILPFMT
jgi:hypothetical protein